MEVSRDNLCFSLLYFIYNRSTLLLVIDVHIFLDWFYKLNFTWSQPKGSYKLNFMNRENAACVCFGTLFQAPMENPPCQVGQEEPWWGVCHPENSGTRPDTCSLTSERSWVQILAQPTAVSWPWQATWIIWITLSWQGFLVYSCIVESHLALPLERPGLDQWLLGHS